MTTSLILPLCDADEIRAEIHDTLRAIDRISDGRIVDQARAQERRDTLNRWLRRLREQLDEMEADNG